MTPRSQYYPPHPTVLLLPPRPRTLKHRGVSKFIHFLRPNGSEIESPGSTYLVNHDFRLLQHIRIAELIGVEIVLAANRNEAVARPPSFGHLNAPSGISAEAIGVSEAGFFDEDAQGGFAICEIGGSE